MRSLGWSELWIQFVLTIVSGLILGFLIFHRISTYRRANSNLHVRGYKEEGTITNLFDIRVKNDLYRFHLV
ncbi:phosphoketolase family protein [Nodularia harveyana]|uniref:phosphoketolase family protein n=1 Tax=Nodularia harveyana TaxID=114805 RepID=UPI00389954E1